MLGAFILVILMLVFIAMLAEGMIFMFTFIGVLYLAAAIDAWLITIAWLAEPGKASILAARYPPDGRGVIKLGALVFSQRGTPSLKLLQMLHDLEQLSTVGTVEVAEAIHINPVAENVVVPLRAGLRPSSSAYDLLSPDEQRLTD